MRLGSYLYNSEGCAISFQTVSYDKLDFVFSLCMFEGLNSKPSQLCEFSSARKFLATVDVLDLSQLQGPEEDYARLYSREEQF